MRYAIVVAALAALGSALPQPFVVTVTEVVDVYYTVTEGGERQHAGHHKGTPAFISPPAASSTSSTQTTDAAPTVESSVVSSVAAVVSSPAAPPAPAPPATTLQTSTTPPAAPPAPPATTTPTTTPTSTPTAQKTGGVAAAPAPAAPAGNTYSDLVLYSHNVHRANHSAPNMVWDQNLANIAQQIASSCSYGHNTAAGGGGYGQNIAAGPGTNQMDVVITDLFYNSEVNHYVAGDYGQPTPPDFSSAFESYGHFTQVVWVGSTSVGCASVDCSATGLANTGSGIPPIFHVCNYGPPGNYIGEFDKNVLPSKGEASVFAASG